MSNTFRKMFVLMKFIVILIQVYGELDVAGKVKRLLMTLWQ